MAALVAPPCGRPGALESTNLQTYLRLIRTDLEPARTGGGGMTEVRIAAPEQLWEKLCLALNEEDESAAILVAGRAEEPGRPHPLPQPRDLGTGGRV